MDLLAWGWGGGRAGDRQAIQWVTTVLLVLPRCGQSLHKPLLLGVVGDQWHRPVGGRSPGPPDLHEESVRLTSWGGLRARRLDGLLQPWAHWASPAPGRPLGTGARKCPRSAFIREEDVDSREPQTCLPPRPPSSRSQQKPRRHPESFSFSTLQPWPGHQAPETELPRSVLSPPRGRSLPLLAWTTLSGPKGLLSSSLAFAKPSSTWPPEGG